MTTVPAIVVSKVTEDAQGRVSVNYGNGRGRSAMPKHNEREFPALPSIRAEAKSTVDGARLARLISRSAYAVAGEEGKAILNGVLLVGDMNRLVLVATDGHRLARSACSGDFAGLGKQGVVVPGKTMQTVGRMASEATSPVEVAVAPQRNHIGFSLQIGQNEVTVYSRLLEGAYPNYEQVIPKSNAKLLTVPRLELRDAINRVSTYSDNLTHQIRFSLRRGQVTLSVTTAEVGEGEEIVPAQYDDEDLDVGYNATYLLDILKTIETEKVVFRLNTPISAGVVEPDGSLSEKDEEVLCLIMPLRLPEPAAV